MRRGINDRTSAHLSPMAGLAVPVRAHPLLGEIDCVSERDQPRLAPTEPAMTYERLPIEHGSELLEVGVIEIDCVKFPFHPPAALIHIAAVALGRRMIESVFGQVQGRTGL